MRLSTRSRLATLTIAAASFIGAPLLAAPAQAAAPVVPDGVCVAELAALDQPREALADARAAQAAAKVVKIAADAAYLANRTSATLGVRNTARTTYSTLRAETVAAKAARVAVRAVLDTCIDIANGFSISNVRRDNAFWGGSQDAVVAADLVISGLTPNALYALSPWVACGEPIIDCAFRFTTDGNGILRTTSAWPGDEGGWPLGYCFDWDRTNQTTVYPVGTGGDAVRTIEVQMPAGFC